MALQSTVATAVRVLRALGGEAGCRRLAAEFYARVGRDPALRPLFPGKSLKCAIEEFGAFLIQFLGGDEEQTQRRWWLSLKESHARFRIGSADRSAWLQHMTATLNAASLDEPTRTALTQYFEHSSAYVIGNHATSPQHQELAACWGEQRLLDETIAAIADGRALDAVEAAPKFRSRPSVLVGLLARMIQSHLPALIVFVMEAVAEDPSLLSRRFAGRSLLHYAASAGELEVVALLLGLGADPGVQDSGGHTPLYSVANECESAAGPEIVRALVQAGADVNACGGVTRATPLHMAARRGHAEIARTLLDCHASIEARDCKGVTPLQRALNCRRDAVAQLLAQRRQARATP